MGRGFEPEWEAGNCTSCAGTGKVAPEDGILCDPLSKLCKKTCSSSFIRDLLKFFKDCRKVIINSHANVTVAVKNATVTQPTQPTFPELIAELITSFVADDESMVDMCKKVVRFPAHMGFLTKILPRLGERYQDAIDLACDTAAQIANGHYLANHPTPISETASVAKLQQASSSDTSPSVDT